MKATVGFARLGDDNVLSALCPRPHRRALRHQAMRRHVEDAVKLETTDMPAIHASVNAAREPRRIAAKEVAAIPINPLAPARAPAADQRGKLRRASDDRNDFGRQAIEVGPLSRELSTGFPDFRADAIEQRELRSAVDLGRMIETDLARVDHRARRRPRAAALASVFVPYFLRNTNAATALALR